MNNNSLLNKNIITLIITHFLWGLVNYQYQIQIQPYILKFGTAEFLGLIQSIGTISAVFPLLLGFWADRYGRKSLILSSIFLSTLGLLSLSITPSDILSLTLGIIMFNLGVGFYQPPLQGIIHESSKGRRGLAYSLIYNSSSIAGIIISFLIQFKGNESLKLQFFIGACLLVLAFIINFPFLKDIQPNTSQIVFPFKRILKDVRSKLIVTAFFLDAFSWGLALSIANGLYILLFDVDVSFIATLSLIQLVFMVIFQYPAGFSIDKYGRFFGLIIGEITGISWILLVLVAIFNSINARVILVIAYLALGISIAFWVPSSTLSFISANEETAASTNYGIIAFFARMGWVPTAAISGMIFTYFGFVPILIATFGGTLIVISLFWKINRIEQNSSTTK